MKIFRANIEDAQIITQIKTAAYRDEKKHFGPWKKANEGPKWYVEEWYDDVVETKRLINEFYYFKLVENDKIIGCFWLHSIDDTTIQLEDFCIHPNYQGRGYGYQTLLSMEDFFPLKKKWTLGTPFYSVRNQYLYEKVGYKKIGETAENMVFLYEKTKM